MPSPPATLGIISLLAAWLQRTGFTPPAPGTQLCVRVGSWSGLDGCLLLHVPVESKISLQKSRDCSRPPWAPRFLVTRVKEGRTGGVSSTGPGPQGEREMGMSAQNSDLSHRHYYASLKTVMITSEEETYHPLLLTKSSKSHLDTYDKTTCEPSSVLTFGLRTLLIKKFHQNGEIRCEMCIGHLTHSKNRVQAASTAQPVSESFVV